MERRDGDENAATQPWLDSNVAPLPGVSSAMGAYLNVEYGILGPMLLPGLDKIFQKALKAQTHIELALVACALKRYYLAYQQYPETLQELVPDYLDASPRDPMNHEPWHYHKEEERGFRLYTVGENGRDDDGEYNNTRVNGLRKDDILWSVEAVVPKLPEFEYHNSISESEPYQL